MRHRSSLGDSRRQGTPELSVDFATVVPSHAVVPPLKGRRQASGQLFNQPCGLRVSLYLLRSLLLSKFTALNTNPVSCMNRYHPAEKDRVPTSADVLAGWQPFFIIRATTHSKLKLGQFDFTHDFKAIG
jgi:hypothetical protein